MYEILKNSSHVSWPEENRADDFTRLLCVCVCVSLAVCICVCVVLHVCEFVYVEYICVERRRKICSNFVFRIFIVFLYREYNNIKKHATY